MSDNIEVDSTNNLITDDKSTISDNEVEINSEIEESESDTEIDNQTEVVKFIFNTFLNKYSHLDNYKNRKIVYNLCKMAVKHMPENINNPSYYLNFIESSINLIKCKSILDENNINN